MSDNTPDALRIDLLHEMDVTTRTNAWFQLFMIYRGQLQIDGVETYGEWNAATEGAWSNTKYLYGMDRNLGAGVSALTGELARDFDAFQGSYTDGDLQVDAKGQWTTQAERDESKRRTAEKRRKAKQKSDAKKAKEAKKAETAAKSEASGDASSSASGETNENEASSKQAEPETQAEDDPARKTNKRARRTTGKTSSKAKSKPKTGSAVSLRGRGRTKSGAQQDMGVQK